MNVQSSAHNLQFGVINQAPVGRRSRVNVKKSTPCSWTEETRGRKSVGGHKRSASWGSAEHLKEVAKLRHHLQKRSRNAPPSAGYELPHSTLPSGQAAGITQTVPMMPLNRLAPRLRRSVEGLSLELEEVFVSEKPDEQHEILDIPDGHRAPVPIQRCSSGSQSEPSPGPLDPSLLSPSQSPCPLDSSSLSASSSPCHLNTSPLSPSPPLCVMLEPGWTLDCVDTEISVFSSRVGSDSDDVCVCAEPAEREGLCPSPSALPPSFALEPPPQQPYSSSLVQTKPTPSSGTPEGCERSSSMRGSNVCRSGRASPPALLPGP